jgi:heme A synthase
MPQVHRFFGLALAGLFLILGLWGILMWIRNKDPGEAFWRLLAVCQAGLGVQALIGITLFLMGRRPPGHTPALHYAYGAFPVLVLVWTHRNSGRFFPRFEWALFSLAGIVNFGLLFRGFMTGIGLR